MARRIWNEELYSQLKELSKMYSKEELCEFFGVGRGEINKRLRFAGISKKKPETKPGYKICCSCGLEYPLENFNKRYKDPDNDERQSRCIFCDKRIKSSKKITKKIDEKEQIKQAFIEANKDKTFFCKQCNEEKTINDYYIIVKKKEKIAQRQCIKCSKRKLKEYKIRKIKNS